MLRPLKFLSMFTLALFLFSASSVRADSNPVAAYDINGSISITGNGNACGGAPCVETLTYSFVLDYYLVPANQGLLGSQPGSGPNIFLAQTVGPILVTSSGPLNLFNSPGGLPQDHGYYLPFYDTSLANKSVGDEIDLFMGGIETDPTLGIPTPYPLNPAPISPLYSCRSTTCANDFNNGVSTYGYVPIPSSSEQFTATRVSVPEPSSILFVALGMLGIVLLKFLRG